MMFDQTNKKIVRMLKEYFKFNETLNRGDFEKIITDGKILIERQDRVKGLVGSLLSWKEDIESNPKIFKNSPKRKKEFERLVGLYKFYAGANIEELKEFKEFQEELKKEKQEESTQS